MMTGSGMKGMGDGGDVRRARAWAGIANIIEGLLHATISYALYLGLTLKMLRHNFPVKVK